MRETMRIPGSYATEAAPGDRSRDVPKCARMCHLRRAHRNMQNEPNFQNSIATLGSIKSCRDTSRQKSLHPRYVGHPRSVVRMPRLR